MKAISLYLVIFIFIASCTPSHNFDQEKQRILALHNAQRVCHFENNAKEFVDQFSKDFYSISKGKVDRPSKEESFKRFDGYFSSVTFLKWDDVKEPIISFSKDYSMAYTIVEKEVLISYPDTSGVKQEYLTNFAWVAIYKKYGNDWMLDCIASTHVEKE